MTVIKFEKSRKLLIDPLIPNKKASEVVKLPRDSYAKQLIRAVSELNDAILSNINHENVMVSFYQGEIDLNRYGKYLINKGYYVAKYEDLDRGEHQLMYLIVFMSEKAMRAKLSESQMLKEFK